MLIILLLLMNIGQLLSTIGIVTKSYYFLVAGQITTKYNYILIVSSGDDSYLVLYSTLISIWFFERETAFAFAMMTTSTSLMTACVDWVLPIIYNQTEDMDDCFWAVQLICLFSLLCGFMVVYLDRDAEDADEQEDRFSFDAIRGFSMGYWLLSFCESMLALGVIMLVRTASDFFQIRYHVDRETAGLIIGVPHLILSFSTFLVGIMIYKLGHKTHFSILNLIICIVLCFVLLCFTSLLAITFLPPTLEYGIGPFILTQICHNVAVSAISPSYAYVVGEDVVNFAFATSYFFWNVLYFIGPLFLGWIQLKTEHTQGGYYWVFLLICKRNRFQFI
jgi:hypothetical protein